MKLIHWSAAVLLVCAAAFAQAPQTASAPQKLTLKDAEAIALKNNPTIPSSSYSAEAAGQVVVETRSAYFPTVFGNVTGAGALNNTRLAAGGLNNPAVFNRMGTGITGTQLLTDFGRTSNLTQSASLNARAAQANLQLTRADVLLRVDRAYFNVLRTAAVLRVAQETVNARQTVFDQVQALANSKLKSGLDVSFANVNLQDSRLLLLSAQNDYRGAMAELLAAMGFRNQQTFDLADEPMPAPPGPDPTPFIDAALRTRPDLASLRFRNQAEWKFAEAEKDLNRPTIAAIGSVGGIPAHDDKINSDRYGAVGVNVSIPIFNGKLFTARHEEAAFHARALDEQVRDLENTITRDVRVAWLALTTAYDRLDATAALLRSATDAMDLAQTRYNLGLSSIVELSQAQLNLTSAEIAVASARYEYQIVFSELQYQAGNK